MPTKKESQREEEYQHLKQVLNSISSFIASNQYLNYIEFDYATARDLTLFFIETDFNFDELILNTDKIIANLPSMKRIFSKPIIALKDVPEVLPVEIVSKINQSTLAYLGNHTNDVSNIKNGKVTPYKLLTQIYQDDYAIYENIVFCNYINDVLKYLKKNMRVLRDFLYASETMEFNLLERVNHIDYFLALGKLYTGYIRDFDRYYDISKELYKKALMVINTIKPRLIKPVYRLNKNHLKKLSLKKTNIFLNQKDYHQVYVTYKYLIKNKLIQEENENQVNLSELRNDYFSYLKVLAIFSLGHFGFTIPSNEKMDLINLNSQFTFKKWTITLESLESTGLLIRVKKDATYTFLLIPKIENDDSDYQGLKQAYNIDEIDVCTPFEEDYLTSQTLFISMENVESFRRLQQVYLKGMVYADQVKEDCPFCKGKLTYHPQKESYECDSCKMVIRKGVCLSTGQTYYYTLVGGLRKPIISINDYQEENMWMYQRKIESYMHFRNITKIDENGNIICPCCNKTHLKK